MRHPMAMVLDGKKVAAAIDEELARRIGILRAERIVPKLQIVRVGDKKDDLYYERSLARHCRDLGISVATVVLDEASCKDRLLDEVDAVNRDDRIHGCMVFRPLPDAALESEVCKRLDPEKDIDGMTFASLAGVFAGMKLGHPPCTAEACLAILDHYGIPLQGRKAVVVGRSLVVGKPVSVLLQNRNATVTVCHSKTADLARECRGADILVVAIGKAEAVDGRFVSPGQIVVDVGINVDESGRTRGDVNYCEASAVVEAITPVPGGVGSVTTAILCKHIVEAAERRLGFKAQGT